MSFVPFAAADTIYRWNDEAGRLHFSNLREVAPSDASVEELPDLGAVRYAHSPSPTTSRPIVPPSRAVECGPPDPSPLIHAITSRLDAARPAGSPTSDLTLLVAGVPVSYGSDADVQTLAAVGWSDPTSATAQGAVAYPASAGCPRTPPLDRYEVGFARETSSSDLCSDYRHALAELDLALSRNENVAGAFARAATWSVARGINLPPWLVEVNAAQTAELRAELEDFLDELSVAREEIERAAEADDCW